MTPKQYKQMMDYLTRKGIKKPFTPASAIERPKKVLEIEAFKDLNERNPVNKADGGRIGFKRGLNTEAALDRAAYKKIRPITQANIDNYAYFSSTEEAKKSGLKYKVQLPSGPDDAAFTRTKLFKTKDKQNFKKKMKRTS